MAVAPSAICFNEKCFCGHLLFSKCACLSSYKEMASSLSSGLGARALNRFWISVVSMPGGVKTMHIKLAVVVL
jgi:hypothetical protein